MKYFHHAERFPFTKILKEQYPKIKAEFDRWLKQVKAEAWAEGFDAGERDVWEHEHHEDGWDSECIKNPYKEE